MATTMQPPARAATDAPDTRRALAMFFLLGLLFGFVLTKTEVISWFRIQEMFRFHSFHMYGVIGGALAVALPSVQWLTRRRVRSLAGAPIEVRPKLMDRGVRYPVGGALFGVGWAIVGACPGPLFALLGAGVLPIAIAITSAFAGTWVYGWLRPRLPH